MRLVYYIAQNRRQDKKSHNKSSVGSYAYPFRIRFPGVEDEGGQVGGGVTPGSSVPEPGTCQPASIIVDPTSVCLRFLHYNGLS